MYVYRPVIPGVVKPPDLVDQLPACVDLSGSSGKLIQKFEFLQRKRERLSAYHDLIGLPVKSDAAEPDRLSGADFIAFQ
ncbi:hypothetical protein D3C75_1268210 [compost metagenome]